MKNQREADAVSMMQHYIEEHRAEQITLEDVACSAGYSARHAKRLFKAYTGRSMSEYIRLIRMTSAAMQLRDCEGTVLDVALSSQYNTHEGFTKAFHSAFGVNPKAYQQTTPAIPCFTPHPVRHYFHLKKGGTEMSKKFSSCTATYISRPARKLLYLPTITASDYMTLCQEKGCEWEGLLNSIPQRFDTAACITLPESLARAGESRCAAAVELPADYKGNIPDGYRMADLPPATMVYFTSESYENEDDFCDAIECAYHAYSTYHPEQFGYKYAHDLAPSFNFGAAARDGARLAYPVRKLV